MAPNLFSNRTRLRGPVMSNLSERKRRQDHFRGVWRACSFLTLPSPHTRFPQYSSSRSKHDEGMDQSHFRVRLLTAHRTEWSSGIYGRLIAE